MINIFRLCISLILTTFLCSICRLQAQDDGIRLLHHHKWDKISNPDPMDQRKWQEFEIFARMYARYAMPEEKTLPLVFNVINIEGAKHISERDVMDQIEEINKSFLGLNENKTGRDYSNISSIDTKLRFCLGNPSQSKAITIIEKERAYSLQEFEMISDPKLGIEGTSHIQYINVWVTELPDSIGGLAFQPDRCEKMDGIYIDPDYFGLKPESKLYDKGRTINHLIGKYLSLHPLWTNQECIDDGIEDTPVHNAPNYSCYLTGHITTCSGNVEEMIGNYMDAGPDDCAFMFSKGQIARMHACLGENGYRSGLLQGVTKCAEDAKDETSSRTSDKIFDFEILPNPAYEFINVRYSIPKENNRSSIQITNGSGIIVKSQDLPQLWENKGQVTINISDLISGVYLITIKSGASILSKELVKL